MKEYAVVIGGIDHNVQLSDEEAERRGLTESKPAPKAAKAPANKAASAASTKDA